MTESDHSMEDSNKQVEDWLLFDEQAMRYKASTEPAKRTFARGLPSWT